MKTSSTALRLKEFMHENGLKQIDVLKLAEPFCNKYGVKLSKSDLSQYVSGKVEPGQNKLYILARALNVSEAWLIGYDVSLRKNGASSPDSLQTQTEADVQAADETLCKLIDNYKKMTESARHMLFEYSEFMAGKPENLC